VISDFAPAEETAAAVDTTELEVTLIERVSHCSINPIIRSSLAPDRLGDPAL